jgi:hypothetical protein
MPDLGDGVEDGEMRGVSGYPAMSLGRAQTTKGIRCA